MVFRVVVVAAALAGCGGATDRELADASETGDTLTDVGPEVRPDGCPVTLGYYCYTLEQRCSYPERDCVTSARYSISVCALTPDKKYVWRTEGSAPCPGK